MSLAFAFRRTRITVLCRKVHGGITCAWWQVVYYLEFTWALLLQAYDMDDGQCSGEGIATAHDKEMLRQRRTLSSYGSAPGPPPAEGGSAAGVIIGVVAAVMVVGAAGAAIMYKMKSAKVAPAA